MNSIPEKSTNHFGKRPRKTIEQINMYTYIETLANTRDGGIPQMAVGKNRKSNLKNARTENAGKDVTNLLKLSVILGGLPKDTLISGRVFALRILTG